MVGPPFGVKVAFFRSSDDSVVTPDGVNRTVAESEVARMRSVLSTRLPSVGAGSLVETATCLYTLTPDHHFVVGPHPDHPQVTIASPCSGHGFKFASVIGEIIADLAIAGRTRHDIELFTPTRFAGRA